MILTEEHFIKKKHKTGRLYSRTDGYCYAAKNLHNSVNYIITQCLRIGRELSEGKEPEEWERTLVSEINAAVCVYNAGREGKKQLAGISAENGFIADAYFLSWYLKGKETYTSVPYATCSQICIQNVCRNWKAFYRGIQEYNKNPQKFNGMPHKPGYLDKRKGRSPLVLTSQNVSVDENGYLRLPKFLNGIRVKARHRNIRQVRVLTEPSGIRIQILYEQECRERKDTEPEGGVMAIDPGVNNLAAICMNGSGCPVIISGRPLKSVNQYYNKRRAFLQSEAEKKNSRKQTVRMQRTAGKRTRKVKDYMHKASRMVIRLA